MPTYDPPELRDRVREARDVWETLTKSPGRRGAFDATDDFIDPDLQAAENDDIAVTEETELTLGLPRWEDEVRLTYGEFVALANEMRSADLRDNRECWTDRRLLVRVSRVSEEAELYLYRTLPEADSEKERKQQRDLIEQRKRTATLRAQTPDPRELGPEDPYDEKAVKDYLEASARERKMSEHVEKRVRRYCSLRTRLLDGREVTCSLTEGFSPFAVSIAASGNYDKYLPPVLHEDLFVEVRFDGGVGEDEVRELLAAYMFELSSSLSIDLEISPRPSIIDEDDLDLSEYGMSLSEPRLRPLLLGAGMPELLHLYNKAAVTADDEVRVLYFAKVLEYVSQTVVKQRANEAIRAKLLNPKSLSPDAGFISELQAIVEQQRGLRKDREAIKQAAVACCDASELAHAAPPFLSKLRSVSAQDPPRKKEECLAELGASLYATRNRIAHAKANYEPTGEECPEQQMAAFAECSKLAAQQAVRWYHSRPEDARVQ